MTRSNPLYYVNPNNISLTPNCNGSPNDIAVHIDRDTKITVYHPYWPPLGVSSDDNSFMKWTLKGRNRRLADSTVPYTIYARLRKGDLGDGYLVFAPMSLVDGVWVDKYPPNRSKNYIDREGHPEWYVREVDDTYFFVRMGEVSLPDGSNERTITFDTGIFGTDQFNREWDFSPDEAPLRVEIANSKDAGVPYVRWDEDITLSARLVRGWDTPADGLVRYWTISRNSGDSSDDAAWLYGLSSVSSDDDSRLHGDSSADSGEGFDTTGEITLRHDRVNDDFNGAAAVTFVITAWGYEDSDSSDSSGSSAVSESSGVGEIVALASASITILPETWERYELWLSQHIASFSPIDERYSPQSGIDVRIKAIAQDGRVVYLSAAELEAPGLEVYYDPAGSDSSDSSDDVGLEFVGDPATANIPVSAFHAQKSLNVHLVNAAGVELASGTIAFVRDGEDGNNRESVYYRSAGAVVFGTAAEVAAGTADLLHPSLIDSGEVGPAGVADGSETEKNKDGWVPNGWTDHPQGVTEGYQYEYMAYRDHVRPGESSSSSSDGSDRWGAFGAPILWSRYGRNGTDGDGTEYAFIRTTKPVAPVLSPSTAADSHGTACSAAKWLPSISNQSECGAESGECTDNPKGSVTEYPYEWVCKRTMSNPSANGQRVWRSYYECVGSSHEMSRWSTYIPLVLDLDNGMDAVQTDSQGVVMASRTLTTIARLYDGASEIDISNNAVTVGGISYIDASGNVQTLMASQEAEGGGGKGRKISWTIAAGWTIANYDIEISYTHSNGFTYYTRFAVTVSRGQPIYQLKPSQSVIVFGRNAGANALVSDNNTLSLIVLKLDGSSTVELPVARYGTAYIRYSTVSMPESVSEGTAWGTADGMITFSGHEATVPLDIENVYIALFNADGIMLDRETVPVVRDGDPLYELRLSKEVVSAALSNWYEGGQPVDVLAFDVVATLFLGATPTDITSATASSDITGFSYTVDIDGSTATYHITISGYVSQQVAGLLAESAFITFRCYGNAVNYAERTLSIVENRQGNDGQDGASLTTVNNYYAWTDSGTLAPQQWGAVPNIIPSRPDGCNYLWNYEQHLNAGGTVVSTSSPHCIGYFSEDGVGIADIKEFFVLGTAAMPDAPVLAPDRKSYSLGSVDWSETPSEPTPLRQYLWNVEIIEFTDETFKVGPVHIAGMRGLDALTGDLSNEMDSIALDYEGKTSRVEQRSTTLSIYFGRTVQPLTSLSAISDNPAVVPSVVQSEGAYTGEVIVTVQSGVTLATGASITIAGTCAIGSVTRVFTIGIVKAGRVGENAVLYQLVPSVNAIKVNGSGTYSDASFLVGVNKVDGANTSSFPILSTDTDPVAYLYYKIDSGSWTRCYTNTSIPANTAQTSIKLRLIAEASTSDSYSGVIFDVETVPVVKDGSNGTSITIKGRVASSSALPDPSGYDDGDAFITIDTGHLWVLTDGVWVDCGPFKGEDGTSQYFHQKWSDDGGTTFTARTDPNDPSTIGETEGVYMGFYVDSNPVDSTTTSDYSWHKIEAEDGPGQELVFFRQTDWAQEGGSTATPDLVDISVSDPDTFQQDEYCPHTSGNVQWTDNPSGVTSTYKYEFYAIRKRISGVWQAFSAVKLWSRYAEDGDTTVFYQIILSTEYISVADDGNGGQTYSQSTVNVKLVQSSGSQNVNVPTSASLSLAYTKDGGTAHSLAITNASAGASISVTDVTSYITFMLSNGSNVIATKSCNIVSEASQGVPGVGIASIVEYYARSKSASSVPGNTATSNTEAWSTTMSQVSAEWPFLWNYEVSVGTDNQTKGQTDPAIIARYTEDGRGITAIKEYYILSASSTTPPNRWSSDTPTQWLKTDTAKTESSITSQGWSATAPRTTNALPYLWNFAAITYSKSYLYEYEPPQCVGVHGDSPLIADLDNEMDCLPVSSAGVLASAKTFTTVARLFYGSTEQTIAAIASGGISFTSSDNKVTGSAVLASNGKSATCTITAAAGTYSGNVEVAIRVTDTDGNTASKIFTIGLAKAGGDGEDGDDAIIYQLLPSVNAIKIDNSGTYSPEALTVAVNKVVGGTVTSQTVASGTSGLYLYYCIDDYKVNNVVTWTRFYTSKTFDLDDTELPTKNIRLRLVGSSLGATCTDAAITAASVITYDMETIPVVKDGTDATGLKADLDNEMTCFAVDENGEYVQGDDDSAVTNFSLYYGTEAQILTNCRVVNLDARLSSSVSYTANSSRSAAITISPIESESFDGPIAVTIEGTCALGTVSKVFTVTFVKGGVNAEIFQLMPSVGAVKVKDDGTYIDPLYISVKRIVGKSSTFVTSGFYCYYSVTAADGTNGSWQRWSSFGDGVANMLANIDSSSLRIRLRIQNRIDTAEYGALNASTLIYDRETIPFVKNGDAGDDAINYVLEASTSTFSHTNTVPFDVHAYRLSQEKELYVMQIVRVDLAADGSFIWGGRYQVHSFIDVTPRGDTTHSIKFFAFFDSTDAMNYLRYLGGALEYSQITADPVCTCAVNLAEPVISFQLSHEGTLTYPVDASTRRPDEISFTIKAHFFINSVDVPLTAISCTPLSASSGISLATCELDGTDRGYCDFESVDSVAAPTSPQIYTITASAVYGGVTYTMHKDISFSAVTAGTGVQGPQGLQGCVIRLRGAYSASVEYVNQSWMQSGDIPPGQNGIRYIDVVQYAVNNTTKWYQRNTYRTNYAAGIVPTNTNYWVESSAIEFIATKLILAENAHIVFGQGNQILILDANGNVVGGLSGYGGNNPSDYRLWLGAADPADAPFSVTHDGSLVAANINSQFQDVSGYYTDDTDQGFDSGVGVELKYVKTGLHFFTGSGSPVSSVKPRVYNLKANGSTITLPVAKEFVGLRVLLLNDNTNLHTAGTTPDVRTHVVQENNLAFLGAYCTKLRYDGLDFDNVQQYVLDNTVDIKDISFQSGIMEFLATPVFSGGVVVSCRWSLVNGSACAKWFDDYFLYQQNYGIILN